MASAAEVRPPSNNGSSSQIRPKSRSSLASRLTRRSSDSNGSAESKRDVALQNASFSKRLKFGFQLGLGGFDPDNVRRAHDQVPYVRPKKPNIIGAHPTEWGQPKSSQAMTPVQSLTSDSSRAVTPNPNAEPVPLVVPQPRHEEYSRKPFAGYRATKLQPETYVPTLDMTNLDLSTSSRFDRSVMPLPPPRRRASARLAHLNNRLEQQIELPPVAEIEEEEADEMDRIQNLLGRMNRMPNQDAAVKPVPVRVYDEVTVPKEPPPRSKHRETAIRPPRQNSLRNQQVGSKHRPVISAPLDLVSASNKLAFESPDIDHARAQLASHQRQRSGSSQMSSGDDSISDPGMTDASSVSSVSTPADGPEPGELYEVSPPATNAARSHYFAVRA